LCDRPGIDAECGELTGTRRDDDNICCGLVQPCQLVAWKRLRVGDEDRRCGCAFWNGRNRRHRHPALSQQLGQRARTDG